MLKNKVSTKPLFTSISYLSLEFYTIITNFSKVSVVGVARSPLLECNLVSYIFCGCGCVCCVCVLFVFTELLI